VELGRSPKALKGSPVTLPINVGNADKPFAQGIGARAKVIMPLMDAFWGGRCGKLQGQFGRAIMK
jgi:uncharacterized glyoxalase superfamily protein PhnB